MTEEIVFVTAYCTYCGTERKKERYIGKDGHIYYKCLVCGTVK